MSYWKSTLEFTTWCKELC